MPALPLPDKIHDSANKSVSFKTIIAQFADGYSQRAPDGLNAKVDAFEVSWSGLITAEKDIVIAVLDAVGSWDVLTWQPPTEASANKFIIDPQVGYSMTYQGLKFSISTRLIQVFDL